MKTIRFLISAVVVETLGFAMIALAITAQSTTEVNRDATRPEWNIASFDETLCSDREPTRQLSALVWH